VFNNRDIKWNDELPFVGMLSNFVNYNLNFRLSIISLYEVVAMIYETMKREYLKDVMKLQEEWFTENITYGFVAGTIDQIAESMTPYCFVAKDEQKIIGFVMAEIRQDNENCIFPNGVSYIEITDVFITKEYRSHGIGRELLIQCEKTALKNDVKFILLSSATKDSVAVRKFYTENGYKIWTTSFFRSLLEDSVNIRKADLFDFNSNWNGGEEAGRQFLKHLKDETAELWVAEEKGQIVGQVYCFLTLKDKEFANGKTRAYITNFYVKPDYRGKGIGTKLIEKIFEKLKQNDFLEVTIGVDETERKNVRFYDKLGFIHKIKKCTIDPICVDINGDQIFMNEFLLIAKQL
jgi:ribosomal protein S18 acetylase RimI-like enzyme